MSSERRDGLEMGRDSTDEKRGKSEETAGGNPETGGKGIEQMNAEMNCNAFAVEQL